MSDIKIILCTPFGTYIIRKNQWPVALTELKKVPTKYFSIFLPQSMETIKIVCQNLK